MTAIAPPEVVPGLTRAATPYGLFSVVSFRPEGAGRWMNGAEWDALMRGDLGTISQAQQDSGDMTGFPKSLGADGPGTASAVPFTAYGHYTCSVIGNDLDYAQDRAAEHLAAMEEHQAEEAVWGGVSGSSPAITSGTVLAAATTVEDAVGALEDWLGASGLGLGVLHMSRKTAILLGTKLSRRGGRLYDTLDTPVVAGSGYPDGVVGATSQIVAYRSDVFTSSTTGSDLLDTRQNNIYAVAERTYLLGWDAAAYITIGGN